jgi:hypothetical protein
VGVKDLKNESFFANARLWCLLLDGVKAMPLGVFWLEVLESD